MKRRNKMQYDFIILKKNEKLYKELSVSRINIVMRI